MKKETNYHDKHLMQLLVKEYDDKYPLLTDAKTVVGACDDLFKMPKEVLVAFYLNTKMKVIEREIISIGTLNASLVHPREVFRSAILKNSSSIIILHNHPSGDTELSDADIQIKDRLIEAGNIIGIKLLDFIVFTPDGSYYSATESNII
jgi:DNA repair protein RadC